MSDFFEKQYSRIECLYDNATVRRKKMYFLGLYTVAFLVVFLIAWTPFLSGHKTFVWHPDGRQGHYPLLAYTGRAIRKFFREMLKGNFAIPMFDINVGMGADIIGELNPELNDPFNLFSAFVPTKYIEGLYAFLAIFRLYVAGLAFSFLCSYFKKGRFNSLIGSLVYCFSGYGIFVSMRHPCWINPMIQLPLLIVGLDRILKKDKPYLFILAIFYSSVFEYYHLYMMTIMMLIYATARFFDLYKENLFKEFLFAVFRVFLFYVFGVCLAAIILFPAIMGFFNACRAGFSNYNGYTLPWYRTRLLRFIAPPGSWDDMAFAAISLLAVVILFFSKRRRTLKIVVSASLLIYLTSVGGFVMNGFQYPSNRWTFGLSLVIAFVVVDMLPEMLNLSKKNFLICAIIFCTYALFAFSNGIMRRTNYVLLGILFLALSLFVLTAQVDSEKNVRKFFVLLLVVFNVGINTEYKFAPDQANYVKEFNEFGYETERLYNEIEWKLEPVMQNNPEGRVDGSGFMKKGVNVWRVPTMLFYNSCVSGNVTDFYAATENAAMHQLYNMFSTEQRTLANALLSEKYHVEEKGNEKYIPYGYSFIKKADKKALLYENNFALPWGYTYDNVMSYADMEEMNGLLRQEAMMQAIALEDIGNNKKANLEFAEQKLPYKIECKNCEWKDGVLKVNKANATIKLLFDMPANVEGYVRLGKLDINDSNIASFAFNIKCGNIVRTSWALSHKFTWYYGRENYLFNLGYNNKARKELTITFPVKGTFKLADIELFALPMQNYEKQAEALRAEPLENIEWGTNKISGTVNLSKDKILCMSVPYSKGWTAYVDGEKTKILRGNYMFMALPLKAGHHDIVFKYCSPGIKLGAVVSLVSLIVLILMLVRDKKRKPKNDDERNGEKPSDENVESVENNDTQTARQNNSKCTMILAGCVLSLLAFLLLMGSNSVENQNSKVLGFDTDSMLGNIQTMYFAILVGLLGLYFTVLSIFLNSRKTLSMSSFFKYTVSKSELFFLASTALNAVFMLLLPRFTVKGFCTFYYSIFCIIDLVVFGVIAAGKMLYIESPNKCANLMYKKCMQGGSVDYPLVENFYYEFLKPAFKSNVMAVFESCWEFQDFSKSPANAFDLDVLEFLSNPFFFRTKSDKLNFRSDADVLNDGMRVIASRVNRLAFPKPESGRLDLIDRYCDLYFNFYLKLFHCKKITYSRILEIALPIRNALQERDREYIQSQDYERLVMIYCKLLCSSKDVVKFSLHHCNSVDVQTHLKDFSCLVQMFEICSSSEVGKILTLHENIMVDLLTHIINLVQMQRLDKGMLVLVYHALSLVKKINVHSYEYESYFEIMPRTDFHPVVYSRNYYLLVLLLLCRKRGEAFYSKTIKKIHYGKDSLEDRIQLYNILIRQFEKISKEDLRLFFDGEDIETVLDDVKNDIGKRLEALREEQLNNLFSQDFSKDVENHASVFESELKESLGFLMNGIMRTEIPNSRIPINYELSAKAMYNERKKDNLNLSYGFNVADLFGLLFNWYISDSKNVDKTIQSVADIPGIKSEKRIFVSHDYFDLVFNDDKVKFYGNTLEIDSVQIDVQFVLSEWKGIVLQSDLAKRYGVTDVAKHLEMTTQQETTDDMIFTVPFEVLVAKQDVGGIVYKF